MATRVENTRHHPHGRTEEGEALRLDREIAPTLDGGHEIDAVADEEAGQDVPEKWPDPKGEGHVRWDEVGDPDDDQIDVRAQESTALALHEERHQLAERGEIEAGRNLDELIGKPCATEVVQVYAEDNASGDQEHAIAQQGGALRRTWSREKRLGELGDGIGQVLVLGPLSVHG